MNSPLWKYLVGGWQRGAIYKGVQLPREGSISNGAYLSSFSEVKRKNGGGMLTGIYGETTEKNSLLTDVFHPQQLFPLSRRRAQMGPKGPRKEKIKLLQFIFSRISTEN